ncbi:MAG: penicillin-binding protein 2 [Candidatus Omnitrophota bacterium]|nr:MAG: penicillin-binding protein 2 [Candidatus Omnitrophota bacterium]
MEKRYELRAKYIYILFLLIFATLALRITYLQVFKRSFFRNLSQHQYYRLVRLDGRRGKIFDRQGRTLVTELNTYSIFADPSIVEEPEAVAETLSAHLDISEDALKEKLQKKKRFVWIKRKIAWEEKEKIELLRIKGIGFMRVGRRFYPQESIAAQILGIVDIDNKGLEGLELFYDKYLRGKNGWAQVLQDSSSREVFISPQVLAPQGGADIILTIDSQIQYWVQAYLEKTIKDFSAKAGSVVVMDASTGQIFALANYPSFNPNKINKGPLKFMKNRTITDYFEPGSVFKVVTLLAAVEKGNFTDDSTFFCENGRYKIPGTTLHDWKPYETLTFKEVFKKSSNIGVGKVAYSLGKNTLYKYIVKLGFGAKTGIDLPGEVKGSVKSLKRWSKTSEYIIPIGQEIGVTLLQLVRAFGVITNGGYLVKPHVVKTIQGQFFAKDTPIEKRRIIPPSSAEKVRQILIEVVEDGTGKRARLKGVTVGGKTGTAQKYDPQLKRYSPHKYQATFVGFLSEFDPPIVIGVTIEEPRKHHFGGVVAAPLFRRIAEKIVLYFEREKVLTRSN